MAYFPFLTTAQPLLDAVKDMPEIAVHQDPTHGYGFVMYQVAFEETFADPSTAATPEERERRFLLREARGLKFDWETKKVLSRPYHKFFNIGEKLETQPAVINWSQPHLIMEKLDGSMLTPLVLGDDKPVLWMTKRGVTSVANTALEFLKDNPNYETFCRCMADQGWSPIFEWCTRKQRIILDYGPQDRMVLTGIRKNDDGSYISYAMMQKLAESWKLDLVRVLPYSVTDVNEFIEHVRGLEGEEGYIVRFDDGAMYKIKGEWYCRIHRTFDNLRFEKDVIRLILSGDLDDAKPFMLETLVGAVNKFHKDMDKFMRAKASDIYWYVTASKDNLNGSKKRFAEQTLNSAWKQFYLFCFKAWDKDATEEEIYEYLIKEMIDATGSQGNVNRARYLIGGLEWKNYLSENDSE